MNFFNYNIDVNKVEKRDTLLKVTYRKFFSLLSNFVEGYMRKEEYSHIFPHRETEAKALQSKPIYIIQMKNLKHDLFYQFPIFSEEIERFLENLESKIHPQIFKEENISDRDKIERWLIEFFKDINFREAYQKYLNDYEKISIDEVNPKKAASNFISYIFPLEKYIHHILLQDGQKIVGSNFDIQNKSTSLINTIPTFDQFIQQSESNPWFIPITLLVIFIIFGFIFAFLWLIIRK